jgi:DNA invertase Pin-like site-specific DNA recombinase
MERYGYVRVSAKDQNPERQFLAMEEQNIKQSNIYLDKMSGQDFSRPQYLKLLKRLKKGDVLIVKSIDRLGRNYEEILEQWRKITKEIGADIQVIDMPLLNTNSCHPDLTGVFIADLVLQILAYVAETERAFIKQRQAEGIAAAKQKGTCFGCKKSELPEDFDVYYALWKDGKISLRKAAESLQMSHTTFYRRCMECRNIEKKEEKCIKL